MSQFSEDDGIIFAEAKNSPDTLDVDPKTENALLMSLKTMSHEILSLLPGDTTQVDEMVKGISDLAFLSNICAGNLQIPVELKQELLETISIKNRVLKLLEILLQQKEQLQIQSDIRERLTQKLGKTQREHILREQLRAIQEELGEEGELRGDYSQKIEEAGMSEDVKKIALEELKRLQSIGASSPESHTIRNYLDLLCSLPWAKSSSDEINLAVARATLEKTITEWKKLKAESFSTFL